MPARRPRSWPRYRPTHLQRIVERSAVVGVKPRLSLFGQRERGLAVLPARRACESNEGVLSRRGGATGQDAVQLPEKLVSLECLGQQLQLILKVSDVSALNRLDAHEHRSQLCEPEGHGPGSSAAWPG